MIRARCASLCVVLVVSWLAGRTAATALPAPECPGDCDGDGQVELTELITGVAIALGDLAGACGALDGDEDGQVSIGEMLTAIRSSMQGCAEEGPDLVATEARYTRCTSPECYDPPERVPMHFMQVCVANQGATPAGPFDVVRNDGQSVRVTSLGNGEQTCVEFRLATIGDVTVDPANEVAEANESNNSLSFAVPFPTSCDIIPPTCAVTPQTTPTPTPTSTPTAVGTPVAQAVMQEVADTLCWDMFRVVDTTVYCDALIGHYGHVSLVGFVGEQQAVEEFGSKTDDEEETLFLGSPLRIDSRPNPCCESLGGVIQHWRWRNGCWIVAGYAFDDTSYRLAPQPQASIEAIVAAAERHALFSACVSP